MRYLIVGSGLFGSVFAYEAAKRGHQVTVLEKRDHVGGNIYTEKIEGIQVHKYGAHIFHTRMKNIWDYINQFAVFNNYINSPIANYHDKIYNLPFNMNTFNELWGVITPAQARAKIAEQKKGLDLHSPPKTLEQQALSLVGVDIYQKLIKEYTEKQWGQSAEDLPAFIIRRLPVRFTYDNNYFDDPYQGIPVGGYTQIIEQLLDSDLITVKTNTDFFEDQAECFQFNTKVIYTGMIDQFLDYRFGELSYRGLKFETEIKDEDDFQGNAVVNYTASDKPYTRIIEHKHFEFGAGNTHKTVITKEYPQDWHRGDEPYYPINNQENNLRYYKYIQLARDQYPYVIFGGRLGQYRYYNMDQVIMAALQAVRREFG